ncbi:MAG: carboxypeptidase-like regulatory domain-containing protein [Butyricimonas paravirosa]
MTYTIESNLIILRKVVAQQQQQQKRVVTGYVTGQNVKDTLPGVTVIVKGTSKGVTTDIHGKYTIILPDGDDVVLCFSFIGKETKEVKYTGQKTLNVKLADSTEELEEVVVNAGYLKIDKRLTSSVTTIKMIHIWLQVCGRWTRWEVRHVPGMIFMQNSGQVGATLRAYGSGELPR